MPVERCGPCILSVNVQSVQSESVVYSRECSNSDSVNVQAFKLTNNGKGKQSRKIVCLPDAFV